MWKSLILLHTRTPVPLILHHLALLRWECRHWRPIIHEGGGWWCIGPFAVGGGIPMLPWPGGGGQGSQAPRDGSPTQWWRSTWQKCTRQILLCIRIAGLQHALCIPHQHMEKQHELNESQNSVHLTLPHMKTGKDRNTFGAWLAIQGSSKC